MTYGSTLKEVTLIDRLPQLLGIANCGTSASLDKLVIRRSGCRQVIKNGNYLPSHLVFTGARSPFLMTKSTRRLDAGNCGNPLANVSLSVPCCEMLFSSMGGIAARAHFEFCKSIPRCSESPSRPPTACSPTEVRAIHSPPRSLHLLYM